MPRGSRVLAVPGSMPKLKPGTVYESKIHNIVDMKGRKNSSVQSHERLTHAVEYTHFWKSFNDSHRISRSRDSSSGGIGLPPP